MKHRFITFLILAFSIAMQLGAQKITIKTGIEVLKDQNFKILENKRIGLITNPTGVDNNLKSVIDILYEAPNVKLSALFAPEHGVRGNEYAGANIENSVDQKTGLNVFSLHGKTRKPTPEMLENIDALVFDIQDIGCRSFTYISTMGLAMEAAAEKGIEFIVLDRPNPLGGEKVEGGLVDEKFISFVSQFNIPYIYGLTCGELAQLLNGEKMLSKQCKLHVVKMKGWKRKMAYSDTGLQWIAASPHIPQAATSAFYPATGILGELGYVSIGVGYTIPFQMVAAEWIKADELSQSMNALKLPGLEFRPIYVKPFYATGQGKNMQGVQIHFLDYRKAKLSDIQFYIMQEIAKLYPNKAVFENADSTRYNMFDKVSGSDFVRINFAKRNQFEDIRDYWNKDTKAFRQLSKKYYLYK
jgi:uncharacterized protein YbbC (DUF1343 family)